MPSATGTSRQVLLLALLAPGTVLSSESPELDEVVVTGERIARSLRETASSVVPFSGGDIELLAGADRIEDLLSRVPNVQLGSGSEGPTIRGQDSTGVLRDLPGFLGGARPRATLQVDGRAAGFNEFIFGAAPVWDVRQVEVFRSPQTTTQGRNSIGGAIFVETRDPSFEWEGRARLLAGNLNTWQESFMVSGPLLPSQLAFRVAGDFRQGHAASRIGDVYAGADPNRNDHSLFRAKLLATPAALPGLRITAGYTHSESQMPQIEGVAAPFEDREDPSPAYGVFAVDVDSLTTRIDYPLGAQLASRTTFSYGDAHVVRFARPGLGESDTRSTDFSVESVLLWQGTGTISASGGVHYLETDLDQWIDLSAVLGEGDFTDSQDSLGVFGEVELHLISTLSVTAGLRYQRDRQDREGVLGGSGTAFPVDFDQTFSAWLPKVSLAWQASDALRVGLLVQRAFNPGGTSVNFDTGLQDDFGAESLWNYELFLRTSFAGNRALLSANLFYNDLSDAQRADTRAYAAPGGATAFWAQIENVPVASTRGLEMELDWQVHEQLELRAGAGFLDTRIDRTTHPEDPLLGKEFQRSPGVSMSVGLAWKPALRWTLSAQGRYNSAYYSNDANTPALRIPGTTVVDARASYGRGGWSVFAFASNVFDAFYLTTMYSPSRAAAGEPRRIGMGIEARF